MLKTYYFKLYNAKRNKKLMRTINVAGMVYNHCIALHKRYYRLFGKSLNVYALQKHITKLKKLKKYEYWNQVGSQSIQDITQRIDKGYQLFFRNRKHRIKLAPPSFKKVRKYKSFTLKQAGYKLPDGNKISILGQIYQFHKSREIEGVVKIVTVKRDAVGDVFVYIVCQQDKDLAPVTRTGKSVGYDFGLKDFLVASDGTKETAPLFFKQNMRAIRRANRKLSHKKKGSNNRRRARLELALVHRRVSNQRKDYHVKLARRICQNYDVVCLEDLNIKAMQRLWGRKISDLGHSQFVNILKHQATKAGVQVIQIPRFYPSTKTCAKCGFVLDKLPLSERAWTCLSCNTLHDRDINAANNILRVGASTLLGEAL